MHDDFTYVFSIPVKFEIIYFLRLFFEVISYIKLITFYSPWKVQKNAMWLKIFWYKFLSTEKQNYSISWWIPSISSTKW